MVDKLLVSKQKSSEFDSYNRGLSLSAKLQIARYAIWLFAPLFVLLIIAGDGATEK